MVEQKARDSGGPNPCSQSRHWYRCAYSAAEAEPFSTKTQTAFQQLAKEFTLEGCTGAIMTNLFLRQTIWLNRHLTWKK